MYALEPGDSCTAGTMAAREESGPSAAPLTVPLPATICDFSRTQVVWPWKNCAFRKSFHEITNLSELTPNFGWSWVCCGLLSAVYRTHVPVGSELVETLITMTLP